MFFSSPSADLKVIIFLLFVAVVISVVAYFVSKKPLVGVLTMSLLGNLIFFLDSGSEIFDIYNLKWIVVFTLDFWPYLNILLLLVIVYKYFRHRNEKDTKK
ncbi:MAG: hypothetical protein WCI36_04980 [bacterium]